MSLEVTQAVPFKYERTIEIDRLLKDYRDIINFCIRELIRLRKTSLKALHDAVYRKIQFLLDYKKRLNGLETHYVDRAYTSARCSICGLEIKPKEHLCPKCGLNRHVNACLNLLKRFGVAFSPTPQPHNDSMSHALTIQPKAGMRTSMARGEREVGRHLNLSNLPTG